MIPLHEISAWRNSAPWGDDMMVEQDLLLTRCIAAIFADPFLREQVAMRGGTVLHKVHLAPAARYSEDIDLVIVGSRPKRHVLLALHRVLNPILGEPRSSTWADVVLAIRNLTMKSTILKIEWFYRPTVSPQEEAKIKVEANCNEREPCYRVVQMDADDGVSVISYDINEMLGTKMRALFQRKQGRDLFDLWWAWTMSEAGKSAHPILPDQVVKAFQIYVAREGTRVGRAEFTRELDDKMTLNRFRHDMDALLRPDLPKYDIEEARAVVQATFIDPLDN